MAELSLYTLESTKASKSVATTSSNGLMSSTDKASLDGLSSFSTMKVGATNISAGGKNQTLTLTAGTNVTLDANATNKTVTINSTYQYQLPVATATTLGGVKAGKHIDVAGDGTISTDLDSLMLMILMGV